MLMKNKLISVNVRKEETSKELITYKELSKYRLKRSGEDESNENVY